MSVKVCYALRAEERKGINPLDSEVNKNIMFILPKAIVRHCNTIIEFLLNFKKVLTKCYICAKMSIVK